LDGQPVGVPREIRTERLLLHTCRVEDAEAVIEAVDESRAELGRWMPGVPSLCEAEQSREEARRSWDRWVAKEELLYHEADRRWPIPGRGRSAQSQLGRALL
jgi:hypothetical protein